MFRSYTREEIYTIVKECIEFGEKSRYKYGGFWIRRVGVSETIAEYIHDTLEKYMRIPYTYQYIDAEGWRVNIVHMPK